MRSANGPRALKWLPAQDREFIRLDNRVRYLPKAIETTRAKLARLELEASELGLHELAQAHWQDDLIATEHLKRLGYFR